MKNRLKNIFGMFATLFLFTACSTTVKDIADLKGLSADEVGYVAFHYQRVKKEIVTVSVQNKETGKRFDFVLNGDSALKSIPLPLGTYVCTRVVCVLNPKLKSVHNKFDYEGSQEQFEIFPRDTTYIGNFSGRFEKFLDFDSGINFVVADSGEVWDAKLGLHMRRQILQLR